MMERIRQAVLSPAGPQAQSLYNLAWPVLLGFLVACVILWLFFSWIATRRPGTFAEHEPIEVNSGVGWIWIGGLLIPIIAFGIVFTLSLRGMTGDEHAAMHPAAIRVTGHQWWWQVEYLSGPVSDHFFTANEIHIPVGQSIEIELTSADVIHSFWVPQLNGKVDAIPGRANHIQLEAAQGGSYRGQCAEFCGAQHAKMGILVIAEPLPVYESWVANQRSDSRTRENDAVPDGARLFTGSACALCHAIRGTSAHGNVGPDLTHLASRQNIAANSLARDQANLTAWAVHAQSLKPGVRMPNLDVFDGKQLRALVGYLQTLQ